MGRLRAFVKDDIPRVAQLYWQFLQSQKGPYPPGLEAYLQEVFGHCAAPHVHERETDSGCFWKQPGGSPRESIKLGGAELARGLHERKTRLGNDRNGEPVEPANLGGNGRNHVSGVRDAMGAPVAARVIRASRNIAFWKGRLSAACGALSKAIGGTVTRTPLASLHRPPWRYYGGRARD